jgi:hypothetical protein
LKKTKKYLSHAQPSEKKNKKQKRHFMYSDRFYFCVPAYKGTLQGVSFRFKFLSIDST